MKIPGSEKAGELDKSVYSCTLPQAYRIWSSGNEKGGRLSVFLTGVPGDSDVLSILKPSGVELGEGQQLNNNHVVQGVKPQGIASTVHVTLTCCKGSVRMS